MAIFDYPGEELTLFARANHWKRYWSGQIAPFIGDCILDVGAGIGATARALNLRQYDRWLALEPDPALCRVMQLALERWELPDFLEVRNGTLGDLSGEERFDTVLYIDVLEHIENDRVELEATRRILTPGGRVVIVAPAHQYLYTEFDRKIGHYRRYAKRDLLGIVPAGFTVEKLDYVDSVGLLASLANKLLLKSGTPTLNQIKIWDNWMVRPSMLVDPLIRYCLGKTIICVLRLDNPGTA